MKLIEPKVEILTDIDEEKVITDLAKVARTCYKSEDKSTYENDVKLLSNIIKSGHEAMIEFFDITVKFTCSRAVSQMIIRHRIASFAQESQRYCNYSWGKFNNEVQFIKPIWYTPGSTAAYKFNMACEQSEKNYFSLLGEGLKAEDAREVLINATKTEINVKFNLREWRHFFKLRCNNAAHPELRKLTIPLLIDFNKRLPIIFNDLYEKYCKQ